MATPTLATIVDPRRNGSSSPGRPRCRRWTPSPPLDPFPAAVDRNGAAPSVGVVLDESDNHAVEVEEEQHEVEAELDERFLLVHVKFPEDLGGVEQVRVVEDFLGVPRKQGQVQDQRHPVAVDQEEQRQEAVDGGLGGRVSRSRCSRTFSSGQAAVLR
jgi:hypothetical protein